MLIATQYYDRLPDVIEIKSSDLMRGSGIPLCCGDVISKQDAMKTILISSSNTAAYALARLVGQNMFYNSYRRMLLKPFSGRQ